ncbi:hypothetical protein Desaci_0417 [Desulfosporosinus acidiphilus SJ4]|uniref:DUF4358 domain-containing protein n=1 Tax=Desulfosporosinus acidiphilus (strain DSM 22704 / JCM 16185 / SJ4) TaxID=646529 RepID=I4D110_DESAJ|nr:DUF4358 domain-containing protein [Desulfosporosinus acidiphilus]AFM39484.1 hypothetical protein Desaci_0417 [Desulfosporosinus acidiphilus SJ4]
MAKKFGFISLVLLFISLLTIAGCGSSQTVAAKDPSVADIVQKIKQTSDISSMRVADAAGLKKLYGMNSDELSDFALFTAPSNIKADEIAIFKVKNSADIQSVKDQVTKRIDKQQKSFGGYLPDETYLIQHNIVKTKGNFVIMIISKDADKISSAVDQVLN